MEGLCERACCKFDASRAIISWSSGDRGEICCRSPSPAAHAPMGAGMQDLEVMTLYVTHCDECTGNVWLGDHSRMHEMFGKVIH